jgi:hypothetical protein
MRSCWGFTTTAGTAKLSRTRWTDVRILAAGRGLGRPARTARGSACEVERLVALDVSQLERVGDEGQQAF